MYLLLILHGINYYNPSFWKWFLPAAIIFTLERVYRVAVMRREKVLLKCAGAYDDVSRVAIVEMNKPKGFRFEPGQHMILNLPWIGTYIHAMLTLTESNSVSNPDTACGCHWRTWYYQEFLNN